MDLNANTRAPAHDSGKIKRRLTVIGLVLLALAALVPVGVMIRLILLTGNDSAPIFSDCIFTRTVYAFADDNGDTRRDPSEGPLPGVAMFIDDPLNNMRNVGARDTSTDRKGEAELMVWLPGCPQTKFEVYTAAPAGYRLTTAARVEPSKVEKIEFGFQHSK